MNNKIINLQPKDELVMLAIFKDKEELVDDIFDNSENNKDRK